MAELIQPIETVVRAIREERLFRNDFSKVADTIIDKVYSLYTNPNCTCKAAVIEWVNANVETVNTLLVKHAADITAMTGDVEKATAVAKTTAATAPPRPNTHNPAAILDNPKAKFGTVVNIDRDEDAYKVLIRQAMTDGWIYRGVAVIPDIVDGKAVWSIFFY
jgi:hypothetical protein